MKRLFVLLLQCCAITFVQGQTQHFGQIDTADLKLTSCDFEKGANAMVLFDKTEVNALTDVTIITRHRRVKILNKKGLEQADVTIEYTSKDHFEKITDVEAHTVYLENGVIKTIPVDKTLIYKQTEDKSTKTLKFSFPAVRPGAIVEFTYTRTVDFPGDVPDWNCQESLPVRYSLFDIKITTGYSYKILSRVYQGYDKNVREAIRNSSNDSTGVHYLWAIKDVESFTDEPFTTTPEDNIQNTRFFLLQTPYNDMKLRPRVHTWPLVTGLLLNDPYLRDELTKNLKDDSTLAAAKLLNTDEEKIGLLFNRVKNKMKWNNRYGTETNDGIKKAWENKRGNSAEINLVLYNFLRMAGIKSNLTFISTRSNGRIELDLPDVRDFNTMVLSVTANKKTYVLDATSPYNTYNSIPFELLNCYSLTIDPVAKNYDLKVVKDTIPVRKAIFVNAQIKADGKLEGTAHISSYGCLKTNHLAAYAEDGESKFKESLTAGDNNLKILSLKRENMEADSLPLIESVGFKLDLTSSDENYIYVTPTVLTSFRNNPFINETRQADIDFGYIGSYSIRSLYKMPAGYKADALPQGVSMTMPNKSISFKRIVSEQDGQILIRFSIDFAKSVFSVDEYPAIHDFYKKMFEMLNEQIVLKKT
ncbi:MAG: DUF3857 domain-containing protein [Mucilaginibacter sp.]